MHKWGAGAFRAPREAMECVVVGAGVVGMAISRQLALDGKDVLVLESASAVGTGTSSRNSQVIHAGIYYPPGSLKARLCAPGQKSLYSYCQEREIPHSAVGKLIVATAEEQVQTLHKLQKTGVANGCDEKKLELLSADRAMEMEPELKCVKALWSPSTGIIDAHSFMLSLQADAEERGVAFAMNRIALGGVANAAEGGVEVFVAETGKAIAAAAVGGGGDDDHEAQIEKMIASVEMVVAARYVINCAGLHATGIAREIQGINLSSIPKNIFAKGNYFAMPRSGKPPPFSRLIYPVPEEGGLGIHLTLDLAGAIRFGPDVQWLNSSSSSSISTVFDYEVDPERSNSFYSQIRKYYPALPDGCLTPDYAGIRSKICGNADFMIQGEEAHGVAGLINLFGIESPGLTASLEIAKLVSRKLKKKAEI